MHFVCGESSFVGMNVVSDQTVKPASLNGIVKVLLNWSKAAFVNTVYKLFKRLLSYTRVDAKVGFGKTLLWIRP